MVEETLHDGKLGGSPTWRCPEPALTWRRPGGPGALTAAGSGEEVVPASDGVHREPSFGGDLTSYAAPFAGAPSRFRAEAHRSAWPDDPGGAREDIGEPSVLVDVAGPGGLDQRIDCSGAVTPSPEPAKVQFLPAFLDMHIEPSSRKRVSAAQRVRLYTMAWPILRWPEALARCSRSQASNATTSGRLRSLRAQSLPRRQTVRLLDREQGIDARTSTAIGALSSRARSTNLRRACAQHAAWSGQACGLLDASCSSVDLRSILFVSSALATGPVRL